MNMNKALGTNQTVVCLYTGIHLFDVYADREFLGKVVADETTAIYDAKTKWPNATCFVFRGEAFPKYSFNENLLISKISSKHQLDRQVDYANRINHC